MAPTYSGASLAKLSFERARTSYGRLALHARLFLLTLFSTTLVGAGLADAFRVNRPLMLDQSLQLLAQIPKNPWILVQGLPFSLTLMTILLAHELGHYITCVRYGIDASLPYFLPAPSLIGTLGAFIRIRSPIYTRRALFDVGIAGPIAGFVFLLPALALGVASSHVVTGVGLRGDFVFGTPAIVRLFELARFPGVRATDIYLHPVAQAAWVGLLATALNLLPIGQLDGGHILYSFVGDAHKLASKALVLALVPVGLFFSWTWVVFAVILAIFGGLRHPTICDISQMGTARKWLGIAALIIFLLSFTLTPIRPLG